MIINNTPLLYCALSYYLFKIFSVILAINKKKDVYTFLYINVDNLIICYSN